MKREGTVSQSQAVEGDGGVFRGKMGDDLGRGPSLPVGLVVVYGWVVLSCFLFFHFSGFQTRYMSSFSTGRIGQIMF